ncbi:dihydroxy-acid dehydratase [Reticulomyxa filosa]|uniref:dihydroxy-acid dehydratase n=1 Tax=Reticulomyxa filosa TaxID=46433 RepID=X6PCL8_RETFI|nr:dihydroxy-acid dehydratase [Reticulomyxa filosa]|eukprot:ETO35931.1 dihydroxy-acid dehydratase [Reticulomyxa filosa]
MACAIEALGLSPLYSSSSGAESTEKASECLKDCNTIIRQLIAKDIKPLDIVTKKSLENATAVIMALGGSTNFTLHILAIAKSAGIDFTLNDIQRISDQTPYLANFRPLGKYFMSYLSKVGGTPAVMKYLLEKKLLHGDCLTIYGTSLEELLSKIDSRILFDNPSGLSDVIFPIERAVMNHGPMAVWYGNIATRGAVTKWSDKYGYLFFLFFLYFCESERYFKGKALCFDGESDFMKAVLQDKLLEKLEKDENPHVCIIRYEGPKGAPGMPELHTPASVITGANLQHKVALITDGRFSGASCGFIIGHITPEAFEGGNISLIQNGDTIELNGDKKRLDVLNVDDQEWQKRKQQWKKPELKYRTGVLYKYVQLVQDASTGCITDSA